MNLHRLLKPRSIAIVGASQKPSIGTNMIRSLETMGFDGDIFPINPKYPDVLGHRCYPGLGELPTPVDLVTFSIGYTRLESEIEKAAENGAGAGVVFSGGFGEAGDEGAQLQTRITKLCQDAGIALCGPNCMGVLSPHSRSAAYMMEVVDASGLTGNVGLVSQSGSVCIGMSSDVRRFGFSHIISSGNEAVVKLSRFATKHPPLLDSSGKSAAVLVDQCGRPSINEYDAKVLLAGSGLPATEERLVSCDAEAIAAAATLGYPVVLKVISDNIPHRTELDLVRVGIADADALRAACAAMENKLDAIGKRHDAAGFLVQSMVQPGVEVIAGVQRDLSFGLFLMVGVGGVLTEVLNDVALRALPLRQGDVESMIDETQLAELLAGVRGREKSDRDALHRALYALADFAMDNHTLVDSIDVNPLVVHAEGEGCVAVDALIVGRGSG